MDLIIDWRVQEIVKEKRGHKKYLDQVHQIYLDQVHQLNVKNQKEVKQK